MPQMHTLKGINQLLEGESETRTGALPHHVDDSYWNDLLSVLVLRNADHLHRPLDANWRIASNLYKELMRLRVSGESVRAPL